MVSRLRPTEARGLETRPKKESTLNTNLLDVDLIRGTAFVKAKPKHDWTAVVWRGMKTTAFATIHWDYWRRHTSPRMAAYIIFHFVLQLLQAVCFLLVDPKNAKVTESDVFVPLAMGLCLGILHAQITSHTPHQYSGTSGVKSVPPQTATPVSDFAAEAPTSATISTQFSAPKAANSSPQLRQMKDCVSVKSSKRPRRKLRNSPPPSPVSDDGANNSDVFDNAE
ncbi:unnamed protein product [Mesocestoides corti]|uniref:PHTF1/2 N-terminal domain-containing protein n=2 Tax=Mesocestoides corti TaxID=53468 RepID=A0A0R3UQ51_MESCO|nr:unnamed protein product [Mesocestoides corti]